MKTLVALTIAVAGAAFGAQAAPSAVTTKVSNTHLAKPILVRPTFVPQPASNPASGDISPANPTVNWTGTATGAGGMGPVDPTATGGTVATGQEGLTQDTFVLTLDGLAAAYAGKSVAVTISWTVPADDYDLYIFKRNANGTNGAAVGSSANGAPGTSESVTINPASTGVGAYNVITVYFTTGVGPANVDQYKGTTSIITSPTARTATYIKGGITFSPNAPVKTPTSVADGEPSSRVDVNGNYYVCGIRGVPAGVDLWYFDLRPTSATYDPNMRVPVYRGMPDAVIPGEVAGSAVQAGGLGGGDIDLAVGFGNYTGLGASTTAPQPVLAYASLTAANVTVGNSLDLGKTFVFNAAGNALGGVPVNDRQWMGTFGNNVVYLEYRNFAEGIAFAQQSIDGGATYGPAITVGTLPQTGALDVDQYDGTVYISGNSGVVAVGTPSTLLTFPTSYTTYQATPAGVNPANIFFPVRVAADQRNAAGTLIAPGTVYGVYSDGQGIFLVSSADKGVTWSAPVQVNNPTDPATKINLLPWLATGPTPGSIGVVWYATDDTANDDNARWRVYYAQSFDANSAAPTFRIVQASDHSNHATNISESGLSVTGSSPNRNLLDYFQINFDPTGAAVIGYTDDHTDFSGDTYVTRQISGPSILGKTTTVPTPAEGTSLPAISATQPAQPGPNGEQVTDYAMDQDSGLVAVTPTTSPIDILSVLYTSQDSNQGPVITATMTVSNLSTVPPSSTWTMYFTANAPETGLVTIAGNQYSKGLSDLGDQFYVQFSTSATGTRTGYWGTVVRNHDGSLTTTQQGAADRVFVNQQANTLSVRLSSSKLNTYLTGVGHATVGFGSTFCGLRAQTAGTVSGVALEDNTRGGTEFTIQNPTF